MILDAKLISNYSGYNMAFQGGWLAYRYLPEEPVRGVVGEAIATSLYARPGAKQQLLEQKQTFSDFVYVLSQGGSTSLGPLRAVEPGAMGCGLETLAEFWEAP